MVTNGEKISQQLEDASTHITHECQWGLALIDSLIAVNDAHHDWDVLPAVTLFAAMNAYVDVTCPACHDVARYTEHHVHNDEDLVNMLHGAAGLMHEQPELAVDWPMGDMVR